MVNIPRCPYCVRVDHFMLMSAAPDERYVCVNCGHIAIPDNKLFHCPCRHCEQMRAFVPFNSRNWRSVST